MATTLSTIITNARATLLETSAKFWTDAELLNILTDGAKDLWKAIIDVYQDHFFTLSTAGSVSMPADATTLSGVPTDCFRVKLIEPTTLSSFVNTFFRPKDYGHAEFRLARSEAAVDPRGITIYYDMVAQGPPVGAPTIYVAPKITSAMGVTLGYIRTVGDLTTGSVNPIPGETDMALKAWIIAHARAKEREDRSPDPEWLAIYSTEKQAVLTAVTPREQDEPEYVEGMFEGWDG